MAVRVALTISGAVSLGSYEGGALAALLCAAGSLASKPDAPLLIDVISGASAGSVTALLAARTLLQGHDPVQVMKGAWVEGDSIGALLAHGDDAPLSIEALRDMATGLIDPQSTNPPGPRQTSPVELSYTVACLRGLEYLMPRLGSEPITASTFIDYYQHSLAQDADIASLTTPAGSSPLDAVLASAANAMGFPPYLLDRSRDRPVYLAQGVNNLRPASDPFMWYTDGGTLDNEPLGRALDLSNTVDATAEAADTQRLHLLIHPHPTGAVRDAAWASPDNPPTFVQTAVRAMAMQRTQSLYDDLKRVEKKNSQIAWLDQLSQALSTALEELTDADQADVRQALAAVAAAIGDDKADLRRQKGDSTKVAAVVDGPATPETLPQLLARTLGLAAGVGNKRRISVEVISPLLLVPPGADKPAVEDMLSGEVMFHFGGFLDVRLRLNDFDLGYSSALAWLASDAICQAGLADADRTTALAAARAAYQPADGWKETGQTTVGSLIGMHRWQAAKLAGKITHVLINDLMHHPPQ